MDGHVMYVWHVLITCPYTKQTEHTPVISSYLGSHSRCCISKHNHQSNEVLINTLPCPVSIDTTLHIMCLSTQSPWSCVDLHYTLSFYPLRFLPITLPLPLLFFSPF